MGVAYKSSSMLLGYYSEVAFTMYNVFSELQEQFFIFSYLMPVVPVLLRGGTGGVVCIPVGYFASLFLLETAWLLTESTALDHGRIIICCLLRKLLHGNLCVVHLKRAEGSRRV
jgi:hypothetical protein